MNVFGLKGKIFPVQTDLKGVQSLLVLLFGPAHHLTKQWMMSMKRSRLIHIGNLELH